MQVGKPSYQYRRNTYRNLHRRNVKRLAARRRWKAAIQYANNRVLTDPAIQARMGRIRRARMQAMLARGRWYYNPNNPDGFMAKRARRWP